MQAIVSSPSSVGEAAEVGLDRGERAALRVADEVHLVDRQHDVADADQRRDQRVPPRLRQHAACRASTSSTARSDVEAPVAMLRVYCSWPGVSATMKLRAAVAK